MTRGLIDVAAREADVEALHARTREVCARLNRAHAELVELAASMLESELWAEGGIRSPEHWLTVRAGLSPGRARELVALARRRGELPEVAQLLDEGRLSVDQAAVVARFAPAAYSASVAELAEHATVSQLRRVLSRYAFDEREQENETPLAGRTAATPDPWDWADELSMSTERGRFHLRFSVSADKGALVEQSIREAKDALFTGGQVGATLADGLVEVASRSLTTVEGTSRAGKYRVYVHLDTSGRGWLHKGGALPRHLMQRITCDGVLQPVWETDGTPVSVGRAQRIVPARTRRLVEDRDGGCRYPGCPATGNLDNHHLEHWTDGGATDISSLVSLCPHHHDAHHNGAFGIGGDPSRPDTLVFTGRGGWRIGPLVAGANPSSTTGNSLAADEEQREPPTWTGPAGERLHSAWVWFRPEEPRAG